MTIIGPDVSTGQNHPKQSHEQMNGGNMTASKIVYKFKLYGSPIEDDMDGDVASFGLTYPCTTALQ